MIDIQNLSKSIGRYIAKKSSDSLLRSFLKLESKTLSLSQLQFTSRYRELIVMDTVYNEQPKRLQRSRQFILCMILLSSIIHSIQFLMHEAVRNSFYETHIIFLCIIRQLLCIKYVYEAGNKNHRRNYFRAFVRVIK